MTSAEVGHAEDSVDERQTGLPRIAHVIPEYLPRSATFVHTLLSHQRRYVPLVLAQVTSHLDEFPVERALALDGPASRERRALGGLRDAASGYANAYERRIAEEARRYGCVLVHAHFGWSGRDSVRATERIGIPLVTTFYGRDLSQRKRARRDPYRRLFAKGGLFVVEGPAMADHLAAVGCARERIRVARIGIKLERFPFAHRARTQPLVVIQAGRFVEKKGFDLTIRAFRAAQPKLGPSELWLIGDGPLRAEVEALSARLGLSGAVRFAGMLSHAEYAELIAGAAVCVQPSRTASDGDTEGGAPTVILEMQALGIPVVSTRHADIPFVVPRPEELAAEESVDELADALIRLATESDVDRRVRVEEARAFVEHRHDASVTAAAVEALYDEVLD